MRQTLVTAFVDWTAQIRNAGATNITYPKKRAITTLENISKVIFKTLGVYSNNTSLRFRVDIRLYHGWHRGLNPTVNRIALMEIGNSPDFSFSRNTRDIHINPQLGFGETLLNALPHRLVQQSRKLAPKINLPDTLRQPVRPGEPPREKMVDTSLACDILTHARTDAKDWRIILAEDDDLVPALFVAEAWSKSHGGRTILIRRRKENRYLSLDGLLQEF